MATTEIITLKQLCAELKLDSRECRERLRAAVRDAKKFPELAKTHKSRTPWQWVKGSPDEKAARIVVRDNDPLLQKTLTPTSLAPKAETNKK